MDIWIYSPDGIVYESAREVLMKETGQGGMEPPEWVLKRDQDRVLSRLKASCKALAVVELDTINSVGVKTLSEAELNRCLPMGKRY